MIAQHRFLWIKWVFFAFLLSFSFFLTSVYGVTFTPEVAKRSTKEAQIRKFYGVCPPFYLRDENGHVIDPVHGKNADKPYSPRKTCGACHDYKLITSAYHFQQGRGEKVPDWMAKRYPWVKSSGQYGGRW
ncbi:conserved hypothetical protein [Thermosulfidibacter takaii ABI70S6]|uniref:Uncharacterized protein n=1 Tax=Thermosulfidibacter takaii (strain DSM 17441 / JCM 13301 / NBRC 103674 / ABI70S6) TaxID=1298851 RepID=A0A0S3QVP4_THET7|nr:hypothetical protein [Thermosulfidibacter takaii]BAT72393.1 conserved hypothetical protein [Thermosulfidibacter takaii ABI70S6]